MGILILCYTFCVYFCESLLNTTNYTVKKRKKSHCFFIWNCTCLVNYDNRRQSFFHQSLFVLQREIRIRLRKWARDESVALSDLIVCCIFGEVDCQQKPSIHYLTCLVSSGVAWLPAYSGCLVRWPIHGRHHELPQSQIGAIFNLWST